MRIFGVIDLLGGQAVHARAGDRAHYRPLRSVAGDAVRLGRTYLEAGLRDLYVADLDAITSGRRQDGLIATLAALGGEMWLDAGETTVDGVRECLSLGAARAVIGLETLSSFDALRAASDAVGRHSVVFSLDLRDGRPLGSSEDAATIAARAATAGAGAIIVLDLARVGMGTGPDLKILDRVRAAAPDVHLLAGGGVRGPDDLAALASAGCYGALVATVFHEGRLRTPNLEPNLNTNQEQRSEKREPS